MELAAEGLFRAKWTNQIHEEWIRSVLRDRPDLTSDQLRRTRDLMDRAVPDALVTGHEEMIQGLKLPDHVLAAAIHSSSDAIVTFNLKDFPGDYLAKYDIELIHPDDFIHHQFGLDIARVLVAVMRCRGRLKNPAKTAAEYLDTLERQGLPKTVTELRQYVTVI